MSNQVIYESVDDFLRISMKTFVSMNAYSFGVLLSDHFSDGFSVASTLRHILSWNSVPNPLKLDHRGGPVSLFGL